ncbi:MAG: hypothetical protein ACX98W_02220 [bacterium]
MLARFLLRDSIIFLLAFGLWHLLAESSAGRGFVADFTGWVVGLMLGVCAYLAHEWSHYLGALAMGSKVRTGDRLASGFLFSFDAEGNTLASFVVMSVSGFVATAVFVFAYYAFLPDAYLASRVARGGALFLAFLGVVLELPLLMAGIFSRRVPKQVSV